VSLYFFGIKIEIVATRCQILRLKFTQFYFGWGSATDPAVARDCNPGIPNPGIPDVFLNPEFRDWQSSNPGISGLKKIVFSVETSIYSMILAIN